MRAEAHLRGNWEKTSGNISNNLLNTSETGPKGFNQLPIVSGSADVRATEQFIHATHFITQR